MPAINRISFTNHRTVVVAVFWVVVASLATCAARWHLHQIHQEEASVRQWHSEKMEQRRRRQLIQANLKQLQGSTAADVRRQLNDGNRFVPKSEHGAHRTVSWFDLKSRLAVDLLFERNGAHEKLRGSEITAKHSSRHHPPKRSDQYFLGEQIRQRIAGSGRDIGWGPPIWILLLFVTLASQRARWFTKHLLLATALICWTAWSLGPNDAPSSNGIFANDMLILGLVMLASSVAVHAMDASSHPHPSTTSSRVGIGVLVTIVTIACGPLGPFALATAGLCLAESRLIRWLTA